MCGASPSGKIGLISKGDHLFKNFSMEIIKQNVNIPLILIDECHDILQSRNLNIPKEI